MRTVFGAELRRVENREHEGQPAIVAFATRTYETTVEDLWSAITTPARLKRWLGPVSGELTLGGRYQIEGNAGGTITRCEPPAALDVTWEFRGGTSWVTVRLASEGARARFTLEHIAPRGGVGEEHLNKFGPGAVGVGWDLMMEGIARLLVDPEFKPDFAWLASPDGKAFIRASGEAWGEAHAASGEDPAEARARAARTIAFFSGEGG